MLRTPTTPRLMECLPTFSETQAEFREDATSIRRCFAHPRGNRCQQTLASDRQERAISLITRDAASLVANEVRAIITLLICEECQKGYKYDYTKRMAEKWSSEFDHIDMTRFDWLADPDTYARSRTPSRTRPHTSRNSSSGNRDRPSDGRPIHEETRISNDSPTPLNRHARHERRPSSAHDASFPAIHVNEALESYSSPADALVEDEPMPDRPPTPEPSGDSQGGHFSPGDASRWMPRMIVDEVENLLTRKLPAHNRGAIYAFKELNGTHVKIGYTTQSRSARRAQIRQESKIELDKDLFKWKDNIELRLLLRLEQLVHADLAYAQRNLKVTMERGKRRTRHEWFEIDFETAARCIEFWHKVVLNQSKQVELDSTVSQEFLQCSDEATRQAVNADHEGRLEYWKKRVRIPQKHDARSVLRWLTGCAAIALLPVFLNVPERFAQALVVLGVSMWTRWNIFPASNWF